MNDVYDICEDNKENVYQKILIVYMTGIIYSFIFSKILEYFNFEL
jgi:hypothetical protein